MSENINRMQTSIFVECTTFENARVQNVTPKVHIGRYTTTSFTVAFPSRIRWHKCKNYQIVPLFSELQIQFLEIRKLDFGATKTRR